MGLKRTVDSILAQSQRDAIEWIVIDGGSTDGSADYLRGLGEGIDVLVSEKDAGIYDAMNKGLHLAKGEYVWFVNAGDALHDEGVVESVLKGIKGFEEAHNGILPDVIFGDTMFIDSEGNPLGLISQLKPQPFPKRLNGNRLFQACCSPILSVSL